MAIFPYISFLLLFATEVAGSGNDKIDLAGLTLDLEPQTPIEIKVKQLAVDLLHEIHANRDKELIGRINTFPDTEFDHVKNELASNFNSEIKSENRNIKDLEKKLEQTNSKKKPGFEKKATEIETDLKNKREKLAALETRRNEIINAQPSDLKKRLIERIENRRKFDTIAIDLSEPGKELVIAGNVKTRRIKNLADTKLWLDIIRGESIKSAAISNYKDFGFQDGDAKSIRNVLNKPEYAAWRKYEVQVLTLERKTDSKMLEYFDTQCKAYKDQLDEFSKIPDAELSSAQKEARDSIKAKVKSIEEDAKDIEKHKKEFEKLSKAKNDLEKTTDTTKVKPGAELKRKNELARFDKEIQSVTDKLDRSKQNLAIKYHAEAHAEMQLIKYRDDSKRRGPRKNHALAASKVFCIFCEGKLKFRNSMDMTKVTYDKDPYSGVTNWLEPDKIRVQAKSLDAMGIEDTSQTQPGTCPKSPKRRKRSSGVCVFITDTDTTKSTEGSQKTKAVKVDEIKSEEFLSEYKKADTNNKKIMAEIVDANSGKITGTPADTKKLMDIVEYEKMQKHNAKLENALDVVKLDEVDNKQKAVVKYTEAELLETTKISPTKVRNKIHMGTKTTKVVGKLGKTSGVIGKFLLAKNIVQGIQRGDTTSLAIIGGTVGGGSALELVGKFGPKLATKWGAKLGIKAATKYVSTGLKFLGKAAGPLGAVADIGLSGWGIYKAVQRLNDPSATKFEQNEAIADIVQESIDIAITVVVTIASLVFPPLAPLFAVIGFFANLFVSLAVTLYKAHNHVNSLNSEVKLLDYERNVELGRYISGKETSFYLKDLIQVRKANNLMVKALMEFLDKNPEFIGSVVPSRTFRLRGNCYLEKSFCKYLSGFGCFKWGATTTVANNCFGVGHECEDSHRTCKDSEDYEQPYGDWAWNGGYWYYCKCRDGKTRTQLGYEEPDSLVDLRVHQTIYIDRSAPDELEAWGSDYEMFCLPSSKNDGGHRVSERNTRTGYLCEKAIGLKRRSRAGSIMLFDLKDGRDSIYLNPIDATRNHFIVGDGYKVFEGGAGQDTFVINGPCKHLSGSLDGIDSNVQSSNTIVLGHDCAPMQELSMNLSSGSVTGVAGLRITFKRIQKVFGRELVADNIWVHCGTRLVAGRGGSSRNSPDFIRIPSFVSCRMQVTVATAKYTHVVVSKPITGQCVILIPENDPGVIVDYYDTANSGGGSVVVLLDTPSSSLIRVALFDSVIELLFSTSQNVKININQPIFEQQPDIRFQEANELHSILFTTNGSLEFRVFHKLSRAQNNGLRQGSTVLVNHFELEGGHWDVIGGGHNDVFVLQGSEFSGNVNGGGGTNTLHIADSLDCMEMSVDLRSSHTSKCSSEYRMYFTNIQNVVGRKGRTEIVTVGCTTKEVLLHGGASDLLPDVLRLNDLDCPLGLTVIAAGYTRIESGFSMGEVYAVVAASAPYPSKLEVNYKFVNGAKLVLHFQFPVSSIVTVDSRVIQNGFQLFASNSNLQTLNLTVTRDNPVDDSSHWPLPSIQFEEVYGSASFLLVDKSTAVPISYHNLDQVPGNVGNLSRQGSLVIQNYFHLAAGDWIVTGGHKNDEFELFEKFSGTFAGGSGVNTLHLRNDISSPIVHVNIERGHVSMQGNRVSFSGIQMVYGRSEKMDNISAGCDSKLIAGNGGTLSNPDVISIPKGCNINMQVVAVGITHVTSQSSSGYQQFHVKNGIYGQLQFSVDFLVTTTLKTMLVLYLPLLDITGFESHKKYHAVDGIPEYSVRLRLRSNKSINLVLRLINADQEDNVPFMTDPSIQFTNDELDTECQLLLGKDPGQGMFVHILEEQSRRGRSRVGSPVLQNLFKLWSSNWAVKGGHSKDVYFLEGDHFSGSLHGFTNTNKLILGPALTSPKIKIDFQKGEVQGLSSRGNSVFIRDIGFIEGRESKIEHILAGCNTLYIDGAGGAGPGILVDHVLVKDTMNCSTPLNLTINVPPFTVVQNLLTSPGHFIYIVLKENDFRIQTVPFARTTSQGITHIYQFKFGFNGIKSVQFDPHFTVLTFLMESGSRFSVPMIMFPNTTHEEEYSQPKMQFLESDGSNTVKADVRVTKSGVISTSIKIEAYGLNERVSGIAGSHNNIVVSVESGVSLAGIYGKDLDDSIWINSVDSIVVLDGGVKGRNALSLHNSLYQDQPMLIDLREGSGSITLPLSNKTFVHELKNIQTLRGREGTNSKSFERGYVACDTSYVAEIEDIWITDRNCSNQELDIAIGENTIVTFFMGDENVMKFTDMSGFPKGSSYFYRFSTLRSFTPGFAFWSVIRETRQVYYLAFQIQDLQEISFLEDEIQLSYVISGTAYLHSMDPYLAYDQQFYASPQFMSEDSYLIQVSRHGDIYMTLAQPDAEIPLSTIQSQMLPSYIQLANKLQTNLIIQTKTDFIFVAPTSNESDPVPNVLTNTDMRSHLSGGGADNAVYVILDLKNDVYIYTGFENSGAPGTHTIDLSEIVWRIRNKTETKYVPKVREIELEGMKHLEIWLDGWKTDFQGRVVIWNGVELRHRIQVLLNVVAMRIEELLTSPSSRLHKRDVGEPAPRREWVIVPNPIVVQPGDVVVLAAEDLEDGQQIISIGHNTSASFETIRYQNELMLSNMAAVVNGAGNLSAAAMFVLLDFYDSSVTESRTNHSNVLKDVNIHLTGMDSALNLSQVRGMGEGKGRDWNSVMAEGEAFLLNDLPDIPRQFHVPVETEFHVPNEHVPCNKW